MRKDTIVQFVAFETTLNSEDFINKWEQFNHSFEGNPAVVLQQSEYDGKTFKYLAQHRLPGGDFLFTFSKARKTTRAPETEIRTRQMGGYSVLQSQRNSYECLANESKLFVFINDSRADLEEYKKILAGASLNIYEAFYENCTYQYILEFFAKAEMIDAAVRKLKPMSNHFLGIYKECLLRTT